MACFFFQASVLVNCHCPRKLDRKLVNRQNVPLKKGYKIKMISSAAPTKPKAEREAFPIPGPWGEKETLSEFSDTIIFGFSKIVVS